MKQGMTMQDLAYELQRQHNLKKDYLISTDRLSTCLRDDKVVMHAVLDSGIVELGINEHAHRQIGQRLKIPASYYDKMLNECPDLLTHNINTWFTEQPATRMVRTMDGTVRAFLSSKYRRIDNIDILESVYPIIAQMEDATVDSCDITDTRMYIKVLNPKLSAEVSVGDVVQAGIVISNSEIGLGAVSVSPLIFRLVCKNGMIVNDSSLRKNHVGRINEGDANYLLYRDETLEADDKAFLMKVQDTVRTVVDSVKFGKLVDSLRSAKDKKIDPLRTSEVVELTAKQYSFNQEETSGVLGHLIMGGDLSMYGLAGAVTRYSQDIDSYDRATEFESIGWDIINSPHAKLIELNTATAA